MSRRFSDEVLGVAENSVSQDELPVFRPWEPESLESSGNPRQSLRLPTAESLEAMHQQAHQEGYKAGYEEGRAAGYREGRAKAEAELKRLAELAASVDAASRRLGEATGEQLLALALEISMKMVRQALRVRPEIMLALVRDVMEGVPQPLQHPRLHLHPEDAALVRMHLQNELALGHWKIIEDARIERGGCSIDTASAEVDATLSSRWQRLAAALGQDVNWLDDAEQ